MNINKSELPLFANENVIFRVISIAKIISWVILVIYLLSFVNDLTPIFQGRMQWPAEVAQWPLTIAGLFFAPAIGLFYFLVLQGVAQGLNLGLDIFYSLQPEEEVEENEE